MSHKEKKKRKKKYRGFWLFVKLQIVLILLVIGGLAYYYFGGYASQVSAMHEEAVRFVKESTKDTFRAEQTSQVYDVNGTRIMSLRGTKDVSYLTSDAIPELIKRRRRISFRADPPFFIPRLAFIPSLRRRVMPRVRASWFRGAPS